MASVPDGIRGPPTSTASPPFTRHMSSNSTSSGHMPLPFPPPLPSNAPPSNPGNVIHPFAADQRSDEVKRDHRNAPPKHAPHNSWQAQTQSQIQPKPNDWPPYGMMAGPSSSANLHHNHYIPIPNNNGPVPAGPPLPGGRGLGGPGPGPRHAFPSPTVAPHRPPTIPPSGPTPPAVPPLPSQTIASQHQHPQRPSFSTSYSQPAVPTQESIRRTQHMMSMDWRHGILLHPPDASMAGPPQYPQYPPAGPNRNPSYQARRVTSGSQSRGASRNSSPSGYRGVEGRGRGGGGNGGHAQGGQESLARMALGIVGGPGRDASRERGRERDRGRDGR
jgi:hypothetical protein